jgi:hypothetical protein
MKEFGGFMFIVMLCVTNESAVRLEVHLERGNEAPGVCDTFLGNQRDIPCQ